MGLISRHSGAPFANGEALEGPDLEQDFATIYAEFNGNIDNENVAADADIDGTKLLDNSLPNAKLVDDTITRDKMASSAVVLAGMSTATATGALTTSATFVDIPGMSAVEVTAASTDDILMVDFKMDQSYGGSGSIQSYGYGLSINATDTAVLAFANAGSGDTLGHAVVHYAAVVPATGTITVKPRYKQVSGSSAGAFTNPGFRVLRVQLIPVKG